MLKLIPPTSKCGLSAAPFPGSRGSPPQAAELGGRAVQRELPSGGQLLEPSSGATSKGESTPPLLGNDGSFPLLDLLIHQTLGQNYSEPCLWSPRHCAGWGCGPSPGC